MLTQGIALMVSAGIKISKARKEALRPLFSVPAVLRHEVSLCSFETLYALFENFYNFKKCFTMLLLIFEYFQPTAANILGSGDLASLSEKATKEQGALRRIFRQAYQPRNKFKQTRGSFHRSRGRYSQKP